MKKILIGMFLLFIILPFSAKADGLIAPKKGYYMYESDQRAVILYEKDSQKETMVLSVKFKGNAEDFAWIVPVPNEPVISKGSDELFYSLSELTKTTHYDYSEKALFGEASGEYNEAVQVIRTQKVDYYDITTLTSTDSTALTKWLNENGYDYPASAQYVFNSYIENNWYFAAIKIDTSALVDSTISADLREGHATPIKFTFTAKNLVYPLKISSVITEATNTDYNANLVPEELKYYPYIPEKVNIELYVIADHKKTLPKFSTRYGNWVKKSEIEKWAVDDQGNPLLQPESKKYFLTKLTRNMKYSEMNEDLFPRDAEDNKKVGVSSFGFLKFMEIAIVFILAISIFTIIIFVLGLFSPFGLAFIIFSIIQFKTKKKALRILSWIVQIFVTAVYGLIVIFLFFSFFSGGISSFVDFPAEILYSFIPYGSFTSAIEFLWIISFSCPLLSFIAMLIIIMIKQKKYHKNEQLNNQ